ncbi:unnamed protein product [Caenorhabditis angaria]|uniref:Uncharacterized protein n=1 Tax=Caenorhabditis angaria TaxID=860376 RepID=A0A9P1INI2_9PELO|nr:unnamed protein product [Caenorhabditis angaria]
MKLFILLALIALANAKSLLQGDFKNSNLAGDEKLIASNPVEVNADLLGLSTEIEKDFLRGTNARSEKLLELHDRPPGLP